MSASHRSASVIRRLSMSLYLSSKRPRLPVPRSGLSAALGPSPMSCSPQAIKEQVFTTLVLAGTQALGWLRCGWAPTLIGRHRPAMASRPTRMTPIEVPATGSHRGDHRSERHVRRGAVRSLTRERLASGCIQLGAPSASARRRASRPPFYKKHAPGPSVRYLHGCRTKVPSLHSEPRGFQATRSTTRSTPHWTWSHHLEERLPLAAAARR